MSVFERKNDSARNLPEEFFSSFPLFVNDYANSPVTTVLCYLVGKLMFCH